VAATALYMSMSLDGFVAGPNEGPDNGLGDGGHRLHDWALRGADADHERVFGRLAGVNGKVYDDLMATGAVIAGRGTFEPACGWGGDHHDGVPIFILSRQEPGIDRGQWALVTYVSRRQDGDDRGQASCAVPYHRPLSASPRSSRAKPATGDR
jgi:dihydrofolate reductase